MNDCILELGYGNMWAGVYFAFQAAMAFYASLGVLDSNYMDFARIRSPYSILYLRQCMDFEKFVHVDNSQVTTIAQIVAAYTSI